MARVLLDTQFHYEVTRPVYSAMENIMTCNYI